MARTLANEFKCYVSEKWLTFKWLFPLYSQTISHYKIKRVFVNSNVVENADF